MTTATLEQRVSEALPARDDDGLATCLWDLPRPAPWWRRHGTALGHRPRLLLSRTTTSYFGSSSRPRPRWS